MQTDFLDQSILEITNSIKLVYLKSVLIAICLIGPIPILANVGEYTLGKFLIDVMFVSIAVSVIVYYVANLQSVIRHLNHNMIKFILDTLEDPTNKHFALPLVESYFNHLVKINNYRNPCTFKLSNWIINKCLRLDSNVFGVIEKIIFNRGLDYFVIPVPSGLWTQGQVWTKGYIKIPNKEKIGTYELYTKDIDPINQDNNKLKLKLFSDYKWTALFFQLLNYETYVCRNKEILDTNVSNKVIMVNFNGN